MQPAHVRCQLEKAAEFSRLSRPYPVFLVCRFWWHVKNEGVFWALRKTVSFGWLQARRILRLARKSAPSRKQVASCGSLGLQSGELVEVKSEREILQVLDGNGATSGLAFLPEMWRYCGRRFRVFKRLDRLLLEDSKQIRRLKDTVLLEGVVCDGVGIGCDRSCFYFWREAWLSRAGEEAPEPGGDTMDAEAHTRASGVNRNQAKGA
jgi:hypothetical protein